MRILFAVVVLLAFARTPSFACLCSSQSTCQRLTGAEVVFLGETIWNGEQGPILRVVERFRGVPEDVDEIEIEAFFSGSCASPYDEGKQTLVILRPDADGKLADGPCTKSVVVTEDSPELALVRRIASEGLKTLLHGRVVTPGDHSGWDVPVEGAIVEAEHDGQTFSATADQHGQFEFANVPPGNYRLRPRSLGYRNIRGATGATVPAGGCVQQELALTTTTSLSGFVFDQAKQPLEGVPIAIYHLQIQPDKAANETETGTDGAFRFHTISPGSYSILVNPGGPTPAFPYDEAYFPGVTGRANALAVYVGPASNVQGQNVSLGRRYATRAIEITMTWPDGSAANGYVTCRDAVSGTAEEVVGLAGVARCGALAERSYEIHVSSTPDLGRAGATPWTTLVPQGQVDVHLPVVLEGSEASAKP